MSFEWPIDTGNNPNLFSHNTEDLCGIFVKSVIPDSLADRSGCIMVNDQITEVDGVVLSGFSNQVRKRE